MIEHRRINHPSNRKCNKFPACENGDRCLYKHEGTSQTGQAQVNQAQENIFTCRTCKLEFNDKNSMMFHRKIDHINEVKACKNFVAGLNCRKGPDLCWYKHEHPAQSIRNTLNKKHYCPSFYTAEFSQRIHPSGGSGGPIQSGPPNDPAGPLHTAAANDCNDGRNIETAKVENIQM